MWGASTEDAPPDRRAVLAALRAVRRSAGETIELIFLISFTIEMVIKIIAEGFLMHRNAYIRSGWCPPPSLPPPHTPPSQMLQPS